MRGGDGGDTLYVGRHSDWLSGSAGNDYLLGGEGGDILNGKSNDDLLLGDTGNDVNFGGDGGDWLYGSVGQDNLIGGSGDHLYGDTGNDTLTGSSGSDVFGYASSWGRDTITDFEDGIDKLFIGGIVSGFDDLYIVTNASGDAVIALSYYDTITLSNVSVSQISADDFYF